MIPLLYPVPLFRNEQQLQKRINEEKRWFLQSCLILGGFLISFVPIFICYIISTLNETHVLIAPIFGILAWILFFSGASFNFIIYNFMNPTFRKKFTSLFCKNRRKSDSTGNDNSSSTKITSVSRNKSLL